MDLSELPITIRKVWDATIPPLAELAIGIGTATYLVGFTWAVEHAHVLLERGTLLPSPRVQEALKFYNLSGVVPVLLFAALIASGQAFGRIVRTAARLLPGTFIPNSTTLVFLSAGDWYMRRLWVYHPALKSVNGLNTLDAIVEEEMRADELRPEPGQRFGGIRWARRRTADIRDRSTFAKGLVVLIGVAIAAATRWPPPLQGFRVRGVQALAVLFLILGYLAQRRIRMESELAFSKVSAYLADRDRAAGQVVEPAMETWESDRKALEDLHKTLRPERAWSFALFPARNTSDHFYFGRAVAMFAVDGIRRVSTAVRRPFRSDRVGNRVGGKD
jgi:hypothetical protein